MATSGEELHPGDRVVVVGPLGRVNEAIAHLGERVPEHLADDCTAVDFRRFGGVITRVRRGDLDLLTRDDLTLDLGDRVLAMVPSSELKAVSRFLGDSEQRVSEIDALTTGIGMALGLGLISVPLPGGTSFSLGSAAGPLLVGMILGGDDRTGPIVWGKPAAANRTIRQLGYCSSSPQLDYRPDKTSPHRRSR